MRSAIPIGPRRLSRLVACVLGLALSVSAGLRAQADFELKRVDKIELFLQHVGKVVQVEAAVYESLLLEFELAQTLRELGSSLPRDSVGNFVRRSLTKMHPEFAAALREQEEGELDAAEKRFKTLDAKGDLYLSIHCQLQLAEIEHARGQHEASIRRAEEVIERGRRYLLDDHRACELVALGFEAQKRDFLEYLQYSILITDYLELPAETQARVKAKLAELGKKYSKPLTRVASWMADVERLIDSFKTSEDPTQRKQIEVTHALKKLVELQEARERKT